MYIFGMNVENHIIKVSFCGKFQKAVEPKRSEFYYWQRIRVVQEDKECRAGQYLNTLYLNTVFKYIYCIYTLYLNTFFNLYLITVFKYNEAYLITCI